MTNKILFSAICLLAVASLMGSGILVGEAYAVNKSIASYTVPDNKNWDEIESMKTSRSRVTIQSTTSEDGKVKLYAKNTSAVTNPQSAVEFNKEITLQRGDDLIVSVQGTVTFASFYKQNDSKDSHFNLLPLIHLDGASDFDDVGNTNMVGCTMNVIEEITSYTNSDKSIKGKMTCTNMPAGDYIVSAYAHARANNDNSGSSTNVYVENIELKIKKTHYQ